MYQNILNSYALRKLIKFGITGGAAFGISYGTYLMLNHSYLHYFCVGCSLNDKLLNMLPVYIIFSMIGDIFGFLFGFFTNKKWTFRHQTTEENRYFTKYLMVYAVTFVVGQVILYVMVHFGSHIPLVRDPYIAKIASAGTCAVLNFLGTNYLVFRSNSGRPQGSP